MLRTCISLLSPFFAISCNYKTLGPSDWLPFIGFLGLLGKVFSLTSGQNQKEPSPSLFIFIKAINETLGEKDTFLSILENNIATAISQDNNQALADIDKRLEELQAELLKLASTKSDYEDVADEIYTLREEKQKVQVDSASKDEIT